MFSYPGKVFHLSYVGASGLNSPPPPFITSVKPLREVIYWYKMRYLVYVDDNYNLSVLSHTSDAVEISQLSLEVE